MDEVMAYPKDNVKNTTIMTMFGRRYGGRNKSTVADQS